MHRNKSVNVHQFAMVPRPDIQRTKFRMEKALKTSFDASVLVPIYCEEVLPGDQQRLSMTAFCRLATPLFPIMDNLFLETFFFFVPNRLVWENWEKFMGARIPDPDSSIDYEVPSRDSPAGGYAPLGIYDYFGLPTQGQVDPAGIYSHSTLPLRAYNLIWNEWFRDQNLQDSVPVPVDDGPDAGVYALLKRNKRHDYFTGCLPWPQKGEAVTLPLGSTAPVIPGTPFFPTFRDVDSTVSGPAVGQASTGALRVADGSWPSTENAYWEEPALVADLSSAAGATINALRQSFQVQRLLERDARGGTRYTEVLRAHFGVVPQDSRLQRPEYLGGGRSMVNIHPIAQTSATTASGSDTPQGNLAAMGTALAGGHGFSAAFVEHGYVIGLANVRADLTYQQGLRRHWSRRTRYDYYFPVFAHLGEQAVLTQEIYCRGTTTDDDVFGYQERWAEYRYLPSEITGLMRSTTSGSIDQWHLAQEFSAAPLLNSAFIEENVPLSRVLAVQAEADGQQLLCDAFFQVEAVRPMPLYSVPGLIDHF